jgi:hypothetical protein
MPDSLRLRKREKTYARDPAAWLGSTKMTQTEVSLRLARFLIVSKLAAGDVTVSLGANELTRRDAPKFPVERFLLDRGFVRPLRLEEDWSGEYLLAATRDDETAPRLILGSERDAADVITTVRPFAARSEIAEPLHPPPVSRLIVHCSSGVLVETRSPAEHKWLRGSIGRSVTYEKASPTDILAVAAPRSDRFRELANRWRGTDGMLRTGCLILLVDRAGSVDGLPYGSRDFQKRHL